MRYFYQILHLLFFIVIGNLMISAAEVGKVEQSSVFPNYERLEESPYQLLLNAIENDQLIIYPAYQPEQEPKQASFEVTIFTDLLCPYCRKLHEDINDFIENGVSVRYVLFPLTYQSSPALISILCSDDPQFHLDIGMKELKTAGYQCDEGENILKKSKQWAKKLDVYGTPSIFLEDGRRISGYSSAIEIVEMLKGDQTIDDY